MERLNETITWRSKTEIPEQNKRILVFCSCYNKDNVMRCRIVNSQFYKHMKDIDYWTYDIEPQTKKEKQLMKQIILEDAFKILENCSALIVDGYTLLYPILNKLDNEDIHEFLILKWTHKGHNYEVKYNEGDNQVIDISGSSMFLVNATSDVHQLTILEPKQLG